MEQNNLDSLKKRLAAKQEVLASMDSKIGRPDFLTLEYFNRRITVLFEQPEKYTTVMDVIKSCLKTDIADFEKLVAEGEAAVKKTADEKAKQDELAEKKKKEQAAADLAKAQKDREEKAALDLKRREQEDALRNAQIAQEQERLKQEQLKTELLQAELAAKKAAK